MNRLGGTGIEPHVSSGSGHGQQRLVKRGGVLDTYGAVEHDHRGVTCLIDVPVHIAAFFHTSIVTVVPAPGAD